MKPGKEDQDDPWASSDRDTHILLARKCSIQVLCSVLLSRLAEAEEAGRRVRGMQSRKEELRLECVESIRSRWPSWVSLGSVPLCDP